LVALLIT